MIPWHLLLALGFAGWLTRGWLWDFGPVRYELESGHPEPARLGDCPCDEEDEPCRRCDPASPCDRFGHVIPREGPRRCLRPNCQYTPSRSRTDDD